MCAIIELGGSISPRRVRKWVAKLNYRELNVFAAFSVRTLGAEQASSSLFMFEKTPFILRKYITVRNWFKGLTYYHIDLCDQESFRDLVTAHT